MNILFLLVLASMGLFFLAVHSYYFRGRRITFNFFFFAFLISFMKEVHSPRANSVFPIPYELINNTNTPLILNQFAITLGWLFAFYLSWCLAERVLERVKYFKARLFTTLMLSGLIVGSISYCLEATGIALGWWRWTLVKTLQFESFFKFSPFIAIKAWTYFTVHFLAAFFLIECSSFRTTAWKNIFFLIPLMHIWFVRFFGGKVSLEMEGTPLFAAIAILGLISPLRLEYGVIKEELINKSSGKDRFIFAIPLIIALYMVAILVILDIVILKQPGIVISVFPLLFFILLSIKRIPLGLIAFFSTLLAILLGKVAFPALIPAFLILLFLLMERHHEKRSERK